MATEFINSIVTITLHQPSNAQVRGLVKSITEGQSIDLKDVTWLTHGNRVAALSIDTANIKDVDIEPDTPLANANNAPGTSSADPAILSYERNTTNQNPARAPKPATPTTDDPVKPSASFPVTLTGTNPSHNAAKGLKKEHEKEEEIAQIDAAMQRQEQAAEHRYQTKKQAETERLLAERARREAEQTKEALFKSVAESKRQYVPKELIEEIVEASATLTEPFTELTLKDVLSNDEVLDQDEALPDKSAARRRRKRRPTKPNDMQQPIDQPSKSLQTPQQASGWGEPPFLHEAPTTKKLHPHNASNHRAEPKLQRARRGRQRYQPEEHNGWATEEITDIQEMGDFDFQGNLSKFDKRGVFEQLRQDDTTADEARLISLNRLPARPGTHGGKHLHYTENVLDSPKQNSHVSWNNKDEESEVSEINDLSSGRISTRRAVSQSSLHKPTSRKNSAMTPRDQTSSSSLQHRYSSQDHHLPSPRNRGPSSSTRTVKPEPSLPANPSFQMAASGEPCPCVTPLQMLELEQLATTKMGLSDDMMVENAAQCIAQLCCKIAITTGGDNRVLVLAGNTKTGARAIAAARQLRNHGVRVFLLVLGLEREEDDLLEIVKRQLHIYRNAGGKILSTEKLTTSTNTTGKDGEPSSAANRMTDLVVDALLGMHLAFEDLRTADRNAYFEIATWVNRHHSSATLAIDVPSGLDAATGATPKENPNLLIQPTAGVLALGAPKAGLLAWCV
ncbi:MAG: hypothetical protein Q9212_006555, partial [Teloschistes hypoglaucus]